MRDFKEAQKKYDALLLKFPKEVLRSSVKEEEKQPTLIQVPSKEKQMPAPPKLSMPITEIYDKFHNPEQIQSMMVIENEVERCKDLLKKVREEDLATALEERIEILEMAAESIQNDVANEFLTPEGYLQKIQVYLKYEMSVLKKANEIGLDPENTQLIKNRI